MKLPSLALLACLSFGLALSLSNRAVADSGDVRNPTLLIEAEHPILVFNADPANPAITRLRVKALNFPPDGLLTYSWAQVQDVMSPIAAKMDQGKVITFTTPNAPVTAAQFPDWGVYTIRLTVTDAVRHLSVSKNTWINVWDSRSHIMADGKPDPLFVAPGLTPPKVRTLSPDPGPFAHPRVLCTDRDWPEISTRCREGKLAGKSLAVLRSGVTSTLDDPKHPFGKMTALLAAYADAGFRTTEPDLTMGIPAEKDEKGLNWSKMRRNLDDYTTRLRDACVLAWIAQDPAKARDKAKGRPRQLAQALASLGRLRLLHCWNGKSGFTPADPLFLPGIENIGEGFDSETASFALAYDFIAPWMNEAELREARQFIFAFGGARTTGERVVFFAPGIHGRLNRGWEHNGDFFNMSENRIFASLAVEGEETGMSETLVRTFTTAKKPEDYATSPDRFAYDWTQLADHDGGGANGGAKPYSESTRWPHARKVSIDNLQREVNWNDDWYVSPWGFELNREAYYGFSAFRLWPAALAYARHGGINQYVTGYYYNTVNHLLWYSYPGQGEETSGDFRSRIGLQADGHDGGRDYRQAHIILMKYMYPDDPAVDYVYAANAPSIGFNPLDVVLFGLDPGVKGKPVTLPEVAREKQLPLTKVDPQIGVVVARSGWQEDDLMLTFDAGWIHTGHMHAEKNSFSFGALGRLWSIPPGYHIVPSNYQAGVQIRDPLWAKDPATEGFIGQSPANAPTGSRYPRCFPTPPGRLVEITEDPQHLATLMVGDASAAYNYCFGPDPIDTGIPRSQFMYPGLREEMLARGTGDEGVFNDTLHVTPHYNPVQRAFRSILVVRGARPYVLVVDDIRKDDQPQDYRWTMNCAGAFGGPNHRFLDAEGNGVRSSLAIMPGATATQAVLYHAPIDAEKSPGQRGLPRLLVRDLSPAIPAAQPPIVLNTRLTDETASNRLQIDRLGVVEPGYKILMFPYRTGEPLPETRWSDDRKTLRIDLKNGVVDTIIFDTSSDDHRTRIRLNRM